MKYTTKRKISEVKDDSRHNHIVRRICGVAACLAVAVTSFVLIRPAITMGDETFCGKLEHTHTEECYSSQLVCGMEEHQHDDNCYNADGEITCGFDEHIHDEGCYDEVLTCGLEEHTHSLACFSDPNAIETQEDIEKYFDGLEASGQWAADTLDIAESMLGYGERSDNYQILEDGESTKGYTFFGDRNGDCYADWNAMFADFCLDMAGVDENLIPRDYDVNEWVAQLLETDYFIYTSDEAVPGDLVFIDSDNDSTPDMVGILSELTSGDEPVVTAIVGDCNDSVQYIDCKAEDVIGYCLIDECYNANSLFIDTSEESLMLVTDGEEEESFELMAEEGTGTGGSDESGGVSLTKQIKTNEDGSYTIRLEAYITGTKVVTYSYQPVDVVLIIDTSNSMSFVLGTETVASSGQTNRLSVLRSAATDFVNQIAAISPENKSDTPDYDERSTLSVIEFNYYTGTYWPENTTNYYGTTKVLKQSVPLDGLTDDEQSEIDNLTDQTAKDNKLTEFMNEKNLEVKYCIEGKNSSGVKQDENVKDAEYITYHAGTATEPWNAFDYANDILYGSGSSSEERKKVVVFFTDGMPSDRSNDFYFDTSDGCTKEEHIHDPSCYTDGVLTCGKEEHLHLTNSYSCTSYNHNQFSEEENMNRTVMAAMKLKQKGATIYSIGSFSSSVSTDTSSTAYAFLSAVSSDNKTTSKMYDLTKVTTVNNYHRKSYGYGPYGGYYSQTFYEPASTTAYLNTIPANSAYTFAYNNSSAADLKNAFIKVSEDIVKLSAELDEKTILRDVITDSFDLGSEKVAEVVDVYALDCTEVTEDTNSGTTYTWSDEHSSIPGIKATIEDFTAAGDTKSHKSVAVTGFDFKNKWVGKESSTPTSSSGTQSVYTGRGQKLVVEVKIWPLVAKGDSVPIDTNEPSSGIYPDGQDTPIKKFSQPQVAIPCYLEVVVQGTSGTVNLAIDQDYNIATFKYPVNTETGYSDYVTYDWSTVDVSEYGGSEDLTLSLTDSKISDYIYAKDSGCETQIYNAIATIPAGYAYTVELQKGDGTAYNLSDYETPPMQLEESKMATSGETELKFTIDASQFEQEVGGKTVTVNGPSFRVVITLVRIPPLQVKKAVGDGDNAPTLDNVEFSLVHVAHDACDASEEYTIKSSTGAEMESSVTYKEGTDVVEKELDVISQYLVEKGEYAKTTGVAKFYSVAAGHTYKLIENMDSLDETGTLYVEPASYFIVAGTDGYYRIYEDIDGQMGATAIYDSSKDSTPFVFRNYKNLLTVNIYTSVSDSGTFEYTHTLGTTETTTEKYGNSDEPSFTLSNISYNTTFKIKAPSHDGYSVVIQDMNDNNKVLAVGNEIDLGKLTTDQNLRFVFTTGQELPETGGTGTLLYTFSGLTLMLAALGIYILRHRQRREGSSR